jgi:hypothetical protein
MFTRTYHSYLSVMMALEGNMKCRPQPSLTGIQNYNFPNVNNTCKHKIPEINKSFFNTRSHTLVAAMTDRGRLTQFGKFRRTKTLAQLNMHHHNTR